MNHPLSPIPPYAHECPDCGASVQGKMVDHQFPYRKAPYGEGDVVYLHATVQAWLCACGFGWTGEQAEIAHAAAIREFLQQNNADPQGGVEPQ